MSNCHAHLRLRALSIGTELLFTSRIKVQPIKLCSLIGSFIGSVKGKTNSYYVCTESL